MDALPVPARPDLARYRQLAGELQQARDQGRVRDWASAWVVDLAGLLGRPLAEELGQRAAEHIEHQVNGMAAAGAEEVVARLHAFASWDGFARHIQELADPASATARFEAAADALVDGERARLAALLADDPGLVRATSNRRSRATLLHYIGANGVEDFRQRTPANIVDMARLLLDAGAEVDAPNGDYGGDGTALGLVATSIHPQEAGVQLALMDLLVSRGARVEGLPGGWRPMDAAVANGCPEAADWLADHGARVTLIAAAALGRAGEVRRELAAAPPAEVEEAFILACAYGHTEVAELFLDSGLDPRAGRCPEALLGAAEWGHLDIVTLLLARGVPPDVRARSGHTAFDAARIGIQRRGDDAAHIPIIDALRAAEKRSS